MNGAGTTSPDRASASGPPAGPEAQRAPGPAARAVPGTAEMANTATMWGAGRRARRGALAVALLVFAIGWLFGEVRTRTGWDDTYYVLQVSSLVEDGDIDLRNDALATHLPPRELLTFLTATMPSGSLKNTFSIGPALLWLPAYAAGLPWRGSGQAQGDLPESTQLKGSGMHGGLPVGVQPEGGRAEGSQAPGSQVTDSGRADRSRAEGAQADVAARWDRVQIAALHLLSLIFLAGTGWFLFAFMERAGAGRGLALLGTAALLTCTPLAAYGPALYTMSHLPSAAAACLLLASVVWLDRGLVPHRALLAGAALGLVALVRWQDAVFGLLLWVPLAPLLGGRGAPARPLQLVKLLAAAGAGCLAVVSLQLHVWHLETGAWLVIPQGGDYMRWLQPHLLDFLTSGYCGLLTWSPVFALGVLGLLLPWASPLPARWRWVLLIALAAEIYVNAAVHDWWGGHSFGARRMTSCVPLLAPGLANLAALVAARRRRAPTILLAALLAALCAWGVFTVHLYTQQVHDLSLALLGTPSPGAQEATEESLGVRDPAAAHAAILSGWQLPRLSEFAGIAAVRRSVGIAITFALMAAAIAGTCLLLARLRPATALTCLLLGVLVLAAWCHLRLARGPHPDFAERALWERLAEPWSIPRHELDAQLAAQASGGAALVRDWQQRLARPPLADAYTYLALFTNWQAGQPAAAQRLLAALAAAGYPAAAELRRQAAACAPQGGLMRLLPGAFFQPERADAGRLVSLPAAPGLAAAGALATGGTESAGSAGTAATGWDLAVDIDLPTDDDLESGATYDLITIAGAGDSLVARLSLRGGGGGDDNGGGASALLVTPGGQSTAPLPAAADRHYRVRLQYRPGDGAVSAQIQGGAGPGALLTVPLGAGSPPPRSLLFGRDRFAHRASYPLWSSTFADLCVAGTG